MTYLSPLQARYRYEHLLAARWPHNRQFVLVLAMQQPQISAQSLANLVARRCRVSHAFPCISCNELRDCHDHARLSPSFVTCFFFAGPAPRTSFLPSPQLALSRASEGCSPSHVQAVHVTSRESRVACLEILVTPLACLFPVGGDRAHPLARSAAGVLSRRHKRCLPRCRS